MRELGYYWVKTAYNHKWAVGKWQYGYWMLESDISHTSHGDSYFSEINEARILSPDEVKEA